MTDQIGSPLSGQISNFSRVVLSWRRWWRQDVIGTVDQAEVIANRREDCKLSERYLFMTAMSGGIAILGLLLSSPAVVIGAMLLSPLMGPIMGLGFALAIGDYRWLRESARSLAWGSALAVLLCALIVFFSPIQTVTSEIAARTRPNLFDLLVALFSALAGAYAMIRGREGTIVGVAIATALMPPLAVVGFGLATLNWTVFGGAMMLFVTNLLTIALTAWAMARLYGFRSSLTERQSQFQNLMVIVVFVALAVPLFFSLRQIGWEYNAERIIRSEIMENFQDRSRLSEVSTDYAANPVVVSATVLTPVLQPQAEARTERALVDRLGREVEFTLTQYQVGTSASAAEQAQLAAARAREEAAAAQRAQELARRLALVAGVSNDLVLVDRQKRMALVRAEALAGATLATHKALEMRVAATEPDWKVQVIPPLGRLPRIDFAGAEPNDSGLRSLELVAWASKRLDLPVELVGNAAEAQRAAEILAERGVEATVIAQGGPVQARWGTIGR
ncbi:MAG: TIGR00341 family protein [Erythrobacter sp.]|nr:TIGR00341 family protein [Erythrobacter sp.]